MTATADDAGGDRLAGRLGLRAGQVVQELGFDDDCDDALRTAVAGLTGNALVDEDYEDVVDVVMLWWRDDDGDLADALMDSLADLVGGGAIWLLTPKVGRPGAVDASEVAEAAPIAGLSTTTTVAVGKEWTATRLVAPKNR